MIQSQDCSSRYFKLVYVYSNQRSKPLEVVAINCYKRKKKEKVNIHVFTASENHSFFLIKKWQLGKFVEKWLKKLDVCIIPSLRKKNIENCGVCYWNVVISIYFPWEAFVLVLIVYLLFLLGIERKIDSFRSQEVFLCHLFHLVNQPNLVPCLLQILTHH